MHLRLVRAMSPFPRGAIRDRLMAGLAREKNRFYVGHGELREQFGLMAPEDCLMAKLGDGWRIYDRETDGGCWLACDIAPRLARIRLR